MTFEEFIESTQSLCWSQEERELVELVWGAAQEETNTRLLAALKELLLSWETRFDHHEELDLYQRVRAEIYRAEGREGWTEEEINAPT